MKNIDTSTDLNSTETKVPPAYFAGGKDSSSKLALYALVAYLFVAAGRIHLIVPGMAAIPVPWGVITGGLAIAAFVLSHASHDKGFQCLTAEEKYVAGILALAVLGIPFSVWSGGSFNALVDYCKTILLLFLAARLVVNADNARTIVWAIIASVFCIAARSIFLDISHGSKKLTGSYDPNDIALVINMALPLVVLHFSRYTGIIRALCLAMAALFASTVILTGSRGGFLCLVALSGYAFLRLNRKPIILLVALLALATMFQFAPETTVNRLSTIWAPQSDYDRTAGERTAVWKSGIDILWQDPLIGVGIGMVSEGVSQRSGKWITMHNSFLQIGAELGWGGLVLFVLLTGGGILRLRRLWKTWQGSIDEMYLVDLGLALEFSLVAFVVGGFFLSQAYLSYLYAYLGLAAGLQRMARIYQGANRSGMANNQLLRTGLMR